MYINVSELSKIESQLDLLDTLIEQESVAIGGNKLFPEGLKSVNDALQDAYAAIEKVKEREILKRAKKIAKNK